MQPWMRKEVLNKFGRTIKVNWKPPMRSPHNEFESTFRDDIDPLPVEKRIRYWKFALGDRVRVVRGELKGQEGVIKGIDQTRNQVLIDGINVVLSSPWTVN
jgi:transcription antitermination factor NusG